MITSAYIKGWFDGIARKTANDNPYDADQYQHYHSWHNGWRRGLASKLDCRQ